MPTQDELKDALKNAVAAYEKAWAEAQAAGAEALEAFQKAERFSEDSEARKLYEKQGKRALLAAENWNKSVQLCVKVIGEIRTLQGD
ncbi:hypothetical protein ILT44_23910 [Microvirga sp. BT689]|uniref:hypothetical protein n=1 Tax=Microvirga arvi TaxID=2778731 RepID=UPI00194ED365|nr:hypothetical protein [Microvirga arvi]MBM6583252.1 hypothetical protein [Microvirga arvi]